LHTAWINLESARVNSETSNISGSTPTLNCNDELSKALERYSQFPAVTQPVEGYVQEQCRVNEALNQQRNSITSIPTLPALPPGP
jgi:predicted GTPase